VCSVCGLPLCGAVWKANAPRFSAIGNAAEVVGQTPWSARDAPVPPLGQRGQRLAGCEQADGGVGHGPGGPPHDLCRRPAPEKTSGISLPSCPTIEHFYAVTVLVREHHTGSCLAHSTSRVTNKSGRLRLRVPGPIRLRGLPGCCR